MVVFKPKSYRSIVNHVAMNHSPYFYVWRRRVFGPKMHDSKLVTIRIDENTLEKIDDLVEKGVFKDRSTAFMIAVYEFLSKEAAAMGLSLAEFLEMAGRRA